jgi:hypothetical protein
MQPILEAFRSGLSAHGYVEGQKATGAEGTVERLEEHAVELASTGASAEVIVTGSTTASKPSILKYRPSQLFQ